MTVALNAAGPLSPLALPGAVVQWQAIQLLPLAVALLLAVAMAAVVLYLPQTGRLRRRWRVLLVSLRLAAVGAMAVAILRPVVLRPAATDGQANIAILVDRSRSMSIRDRQRDAAQLVALAEGLGRLPPGVRTKVDDVLGGVAAARESLRELSLAFSELQNALVAGRNVDAARARQREAQAKFDPVARQLAERSGLVKPDSALGEALASLRSLLDQPRDDAWPATAGSVLDRIAATALAFQAETDRELYRGNADVRAVCNELHALSRLGLVEQALTRPRTGLLWRLPAPPRVTCFGYAVAEDVQPLPLRGGGQPVRRLLIDANGVASDTIGALRDVMNRLAGVSLRAIVFFTDGHRATGSDAAASPTAASFATDGVPLYAVPVAPSWSGRDLAVARLFAPDRAALGQAVPVRVRLHANGMRGTTVQVRLDAYADGDPQRGRAPQSQPATARATTRTVAAATRAAIAGTRPATFPATAPAPLASQQKRATIGDDDAAEVEFTIRLTAPGSCRLLATVPQLPNELTYANNEAEAWVHVVAQPTRVLMLGQGAGWDFRCYRDAYAAAPGIRLQCVLLDGNDAAAASLPARDIEDNDVIVLCDVAAGSLAPAQWAAVCTSVERGGAAVLIAGDEHCPSEYAGPALAPLLPFAEPSGATWREWRGNEGGYFLDPSDAAGGLDALRLADDEASSRRRWAALPPLFRYLEMPPLQAGAKALVEVQGSRRPVITEHALGHGRVLFVGVNELWRWRFRGAPEQDRLWLQLLRHVAERPYLASTCGGALSLDVGKAAVTPGQSVAIRARVLDDSGVPVSAPVVDVDVLQDKQVVRTLKLGAAGGAGSGRFAGWLAGLSAGTYTLRLRDAGGGVAAGPAPQCALRVAPSYTAELADVAGDRESLRRLVDACGGEVLPLEQVDQLAQRLAAVERPGAAAAPLRIWDSPYLFAFVVACFTAEWAVRKRIGLA